jgi:hypothetical protein
LAEAVIKEVTLAGFDQTWKTEFAASGAGFLPGAGEECPGSRHTTAFSQGRGELFVNKAPGHLPVGAGDPEVRIEKLFMTGDGGETFIRGRDEDRTGEATAATEQEVDKFLLGMFRMRGAEAQLNKAGALGKVLIVVMDENNGDPHDPEGTDHPQGCRLSG